MINTPKLANEVVNLCAWIYDQAELGVQDAFDLLISLLFGSLFVESSRILFFQLHPIYFFRLNLEIIFQDFSWKKKEHALDIGNVPGAALRLRE